VGWMWPWWICVFRFQAMTQLRWQRSLPWKKACW
jgi:hypothetical protein